jgi:hypothetical protein
MPAGVHVSSDWTHQIQGYKLGVYIHPRGVPGHTRQMTNLSDIPDPGLGTAPTEYWPNSMQCDVLGRRGNPRPLLATRLNPNTQPHSNPYSQQAAGHVGNLSIHATTTICRLHFCIHAEGSRPGVCPTLAHAKASCSPGRQHSIVAVSARP